MTIKTIFLNQKIANQLYKLFGDRQTVIDYQSKVNTHKHKNNIVRGDDVIMTDENGNYIQ